MLPTSAPTFPPPTNGLPPVSSPSFPPPPLQLSVSETSTWQRIPVTAIWTPTHWSMAMQNLHSVLVTRGLGREIKVTTPHSMVVLASYSPPSASTFAPNFVEPMSSVIGENRSAVDLEYALLGNATGVHDPKGYIYNNMLDAQIDAIRLAINALGFGNQTIEITVSESGWPSKGAPGDAAATPDNAKKYKTRLIERVQSNKGTN
ncbi:hypothetical protein SLEP1_g51611 [Rubroshorea leprosula]|uniref:glucan endo-1,3-beta-D-glucosidase n=1 Tax=Rubroshorea leprosula TaxID=152421 RepID=A0AAV5M6B5_9ROSI|nr:hypothetical protein SLEP1_g51611 [Rubroshorea leprosula]